MNEKTTQTVDPAETCECNPEWSNAPGSSDCDSSRCSVPDKSEPEIVQNKE